MRRPGVVCIAARNTGKKYGSMDRLLLAAAITALIPLGCGPDFKDRRTPSGDFCSDMPIIPAGQEPDREYHRLQPIQSDPKARTEAERLESLRKVACKVGADAVIEAVNEEVRGDNAQYQTVSSGTAVIWLRRSGPSETKIQSVPAKKAPVAQEAPPATAEPAQTAAPSASASAGKPGPKPKKALPIKN
jgi:hypothetical protein